jgi:hypothetical protein
MTKSERRVERNTFACRCGHLAYWIRYRGWMCFCSNPTTQAGAEKATRTNRGPLVR